MYLTRHENRLLHGCRRYSEGRGGELLTLHTGYGHIKSVVNSLIFVGMEKMPDCISDSVDRGITWESNPD